MTEPSDPKRHPARDACGALLSISEDFHQLLRANCRRCATGTGQCGVEVIRQALAADEGAPLALDAPAAYAQPSRH
ncbi:hypothetical protein CKO28_11635 [Rhodovibrio sodomensis]|uniref:Uncharacterized protein n=1 Tax=Rhodovibrio sodomensis TaxID=1088 RepID=A0ABS1DE35_9PROT|nr:hypothetical protein [Rhodovibrio sodomensis]MBK1668679.1 hypothetical protein [Rhodovibrio sodomensis]